MIRRHVRAVLLAAALTGVLVVIGSPDPEPRCPTEDSCRAAYRPGGWQIVGDRP